MKLLRSSIFFVITMIVAALPASTATTPTRVDVLVGSAAPELERYSAQQLCGYLEKLFGIRAEPMTKPTTSAQVFFLIGSPGTNSAVRQATARAPFPKLSDQGLVLRTTSFHNRPALIVGGGTPRATMWAVYELVERWGVRYLLHGDVLPEKMGAFEIPQMNLVMEPKLRVRGWRVVNDFACGPESWGMTDYRPLLDQLAKMKFNRLLLSLYPWQPFLDYRVGGVPRRSAGLWYNFHYPVTDDMPGRELFGDAKEFWNPDLPRAADYSKFVAAGERLIHKLMEYGHSRGMDCIITNSLTEFPPEFAPLLKTTQRVHQLGDMTIVPGAGTDINDPSLVALASAVLRATVNTYPEADSVMLGMPEFRQWVAQYERAWQALDSKYGISEVRSLTEVMAAAQHRAGYPGEADRAVQEVKGDLTALYFYDYLLNDRKTLKDTRRPDMKIIYGEVAEELFPVLGRLLPRGFEMMENVDYTPSRVLRRRQVLKDFPAHEIPATLVYTLHDDNIGLVPQLTSDSLYQLTQELEHDGWAGFMTRYWLIGDHDPNVVYLARAAWDPDATPDAVDANLLASICGKLCVDDMLTVFHAVESITVNLEWNNLGFSFPVPGMMMKHWKPGPMPPDLVEDRQDYQKALAAARRAQSNSTADGRRYVDTWVGRLEFAVGYLDTVEAVHRAATAEAAKNGAEALSETTLALATARRAINAYTSVAQDQSDRGAIAVMDEYVYRPLQAKLSELGKRMPAQAE